MSRVRCRPEEIIADRPAYCHLERWCSRDSALARESHETTLEYRNAPHLPLADRSW